ncbi:unnamed protein product [Linum trigynum]|uniref:Uncharacterized protein n=1 Tax=Linum trigynum TaxID=586398 RepID=A0AAV2E5G1_9ROSI
MVTGWRRAFCTSIPKEKLDTAASSDKQQPHCSGAGSTSNSPRISSKFGFFSNPSTPRLHSQSQPPPGPSTLRCRTTAAAGSPTSSLPNSPKLHCKTANVSSACKPASAINSPRFFNFSSNPSSPKSPSSFSLLKSTLRLSKSRCGICAQTVKSGQGTAIFTAECGHAFHFPCVTSHFTKQHLLLCPVCNSAWKELPLLSVYQNSEFRMEETRFDGESKPKNLRVYNDDEPLMSPSPGSLCNPIPELEETDPELDDDHGSSDVEFQGFFVNPAQGRGRKENPNHDLNIVVGAKNVEVSLLPESALVAAVRGYETHVMVMKVRAPPAPRGARRAPVDLVTVLDVSDRMSGTKSQMVKRAMKLVISSLTRTDRLSIVAFAGSSKRLLPLRRMTANGRRSARRVVESLGTTGQGMTVNDALKKALKVIEDRREKNPVATILILSDGREDRTRITSLRNNPSSSPLVSSTRYSDSGTPVHSIGLGDVTAYKHAPLEDAFSKCLGGLLRVVVQDLKLQVGFASGSAPAEVAAVYSVTGPPAVFGPGSIRVGDLHVEEERELLVELRVPSSASSRAHRMLSVRSSFRDTCSQEVINGREQCLVIPSLQAVRSNGLLTGRLRNVHVAVRGVAESRRLIEHGDFSGAYHLLSSARALLMQRSDGTAGECLRCVDAELAELQRRKPQLIRQPQQRSGGGQQQEEVKGEPLTPMSAWRAAEKLAKLAIMRKHMNRVSDMHGFENARF